MDFKDNYNLMKFGQLTLLLFSCGPSTGISIVVIKLPTIVATAKAAKTYENMYMYVC